MLLVKTMQNCHVIKKFRHKRFFPKGLSVVCLSMCACGVVCFLCRCVCVELSVVCVGVRVGLSVVCVGMPVGLSVVCLCRCACGVVCCLCRCACGVVCCLCRCAPLRLCVCVCLYIQNVINQARVKRFTCRAVQVSKN